jgi:hypothetical protein
MSTHNINKPATELAKGENPDVAGLHNENDFNMLTPLLIHPDLFRLSGSNPARSQRSIPSAAAFACTFRQAVPVKGKSTASSRHWFYLTISSQAKLANS